MTETYHEHPDAGEAWISAREAYEMVCERNGSPDAALAIARRAHSGLIRTWAAHSTRQQRTAQGNIESITQTDGELSKEFWELEGEAPFEENWAAGDFRTWTFDKFPRQGEFEWQAFGVKFARDGILALVETARLAGSDPVANAENEDATSPSCPVPSDEEIQAKMNELYDLGVKRDVAAKLIRQLPGFEGVGNQHARRAANGNLPLGRPKNRQP